MITVHQNTKFNLEQGLTIENLFSSEILQNIELFKSGKLDYLIIRGMPVSEILPNTPLEIREQTFPELEKNILTTIAQYLGAISDKGIEHTIRFNLEGEGTNNETWHSHFQFKSSLFYCVRADESAKTYYLVAGNVARSAGELLPDLLTPYSYIADTPAFPLIELHDGTYTFSKYIFERSELEKFVKDLDLPDAVKMLRKIVKNVTDKKYAHAAAFLLSQLEDAQEYISYLPGDLVLLHEPRVIRFSPGYKTNIPVERARWLLAVSLEN